MLRRLFSTLANLGLTFLQFLSFLGILVFSGVLMWRFVYDPDSFNESIQALGFPGALVIVLLIFRKTILTWVEKATEISLRYKDAEVRATTKDFSDQVVQAFENADFKSEIGNAETAKLMELAAEWGYNMSKMGFKSVPVPAIEWLDGKPNIKFGYSRQPSNVEDKDFLVAEIIRIQNEIDSLGPLERVAFALNGSREQILKKQLSQKKDLLRQIDPDSIFAK